ncbi:hypothetical protein ACSVIJ_12315 [Pseudomonas sp. NCHU5208]|uniref:hypothetical protein n=1 Tax=unclassified Pseudomonas TaxID=196821 RepID=UPI003F97AED3
MDEVNGVNEQENSLPPTTAPNFRINLLGFEDQEVARRLGRTIGEWVNLIGRYYDLSALDGITVAIDYNQALYDLDRGYETNFRLTATNSHVVGVAMTPSVIREAQLRSHIVLNAVFMTPLLNADDLEPHAQALHILAHECAHVEVTHVYDRCFPNVLLRESFGGMLEQCRWQVIFAVWDEYAVTSLIGHIGAAQTDAYEVAFLNDLATFDDRVNALIRDYRLHGNVDQVLTEVYGACGNLLKFAAYHLGNLNSFDRDWRSCERTFTALNDEWFEPYLDRLSECCEVIKSSYGAWSSQDCFREISIIAEELVERAGLFIEEQGDGTLYVDIPFTPETEPV